MTNKDSGFDMIKNKVVSQTAQLSNAGYLHFKDFADAATITLLREEVEKVGVYLVKNNVLLINGAPVKSVVDAKGKRSVEHIPFVSTYSNKLKTFFDSDQLQALLSMLGDSAKSYEYEFAFLNQILHAGGANDPCLRQRKDWWKFGRTVSSNTLNVWLYLEDVLPGKNLPGRTGLLRRLIAKLSISNRIGNTPDTIKAGDIMICQGVPAQWMKKKIGSQQAQHKVLCITVSKVESVKLPGELRSATYVNPGQWRNLFDKNITRNALPELSCP